MFTIGCGKKQETVYVTQNGCSISEIENGVSIMCGSDVSYIYNGSDGQNGTEFKIVDPCGNGPGHDEIGFVFETGEFVFWYKDLGLAVLSQNVSYVTTDSQRCVFRIVDGELTY